MTATDTTVEAVEAVVDAVPAVGGRGLGFAVGALLLGAGIGGGVGYLLARRRLETKYSLIAEEQIAEMREHYAAKTRALESESRKRPVEEIVRERGYTSPDKDRTKPPMAVQPPDSVVASEDEAAGEPADDDSEMAADDVEGPNGVRQPEPEVRNVFRDNRPPPDEWDYAEERKRRSPDVPYVIHYDERHEMDGYDDMTLTYYESDDVLCNERDEIVDPAQRNLMIGEDNLNKFGHGSNDKDIVFVRNDQLEIVFQIIKSPNSYAEEVHGFSHDSGYGGNVQRMRLRERDEPEE
jgi:hypothetical protein